MKNIYKLVIKNIIPTEGNYDVTVAVAYSEFPVIPLFQISVDVPRKNEAPLEYYEEIALMKASRLISDVNDSLIKAA
ncbi:DUF1327 domain-containing protein [Superficieibacter sp.]|uniref:DUF1327 domain-containing protein n=1 Tax=Superficieibacter sp. TaxID=2303322 RepID=UPI0028AB0364|nr:DUF1327 domain-containing protein [Superficieibacter sp.]